MDGKIVETLRHTIGPPERLHEFRRNSSLAGVVGRWRHDGARVHFSVDAPLHVVFNISSGQRVELLTSATSAVETMRAGSIRLVAPGEVTSVAVTGRADAVHFFVDRALIATAGHHAPTAPAHTLDAAATESELRRAAARAFVALSRSDDDAELMLHDSFESLVKTFRTSHTSGTEPAGLPLESLLRVTAVIDERLARESAALPQVAELAAIVGLSEFHFIRAFRRCVGQPPHARMQALRMDVALAQLLTGARQVNDVADNLGFASPSHFVAVFRKHFGVTPGSVRTAVIA